MYEYVAKITRVVDGDTVDADVDIGFNVHVQERFRLYGINTPEVHSKDQKEKVAGEAAKTRLMGLVLGKVVAIKTMKDDQEKYGRYLATLVTDDKVNVNDLLVKEGLAKPYFGVGQKPI